MRATKFSKGRGRGTYEGLDKQYPSHSHLGAFFFLLAVRSFFGKIIKWMFILFNIFMIVWVIGALNIGGEAVSDASSDAAAAGAAIGSAIGVGFIALIWVFGDIILGMVFLFTRPSKN